MPMAWIGVSGLKHRAGRPLAGHPGRMSARLRAFQQPTRCEEISMKSTIRGAVLGLAVMLGAQAAHAQGMSFGFGGGVVVPTGTLSDGTSTGYTGSALVRLQPPASPVGFHVDAFYTRFGLDGGVDGHSRMIGGTANAVFAFPGASLARPYLFGGLGVYNGQTTVGDVSFDSQTKFGFNAGAGF